MIFHIYSVVKSKIEKEAERGLKKKNSGIYSLDSLMLNRTWNLPSAKLEMLDLRTSSSMIKARSKSLTCTRGQEKFRTLVKASKIKSPT